MSKVEDIAAKQIILSDKVDNATEGITTILSQLSNVTHDLDDETKEAVGELVTTVCSTSPSMKDIKVRNTPCGTSSLIISSDQVKLICQQVTELFNDLTSFRAELRSINNDLENHIVKQEENMQLMKAQHDEAMTQMKTKFENDLAKIRKDNEMEVRSLKAKCNDNYQYSCKNNLVFDNFLVPNWAYEKDCNGFELAKYVAFYINEFIPMLQTPVSPHNIDITHPLRNNANGQPVIIVRFVNRHICSYCVFFPCLPPQ